MQFDLTIDQFRAYILGCRSKSTALAYTAAATRFVQFCGANGLNIARLPPGALTLFSEFLVANGLAASSVHTWSAGAKKYLGWLTAKGLITSANFTDPDLPKITKGEPNILRPDDLLSFLKLATTLEEPVRTACLLLPFCGLRSNELTQMKVSSIRKVDVPNKDGSKTSYVCFTVRGKGGDVRTVPLILDGRAVLVRYLGGWRRSRPNSWLFPMPSGEPLANRTLRRYVQWIREQRGIGDRLTPHTLRRTYITTLFRAGIDIPTLTKIAGHRSVQTTMDHYLEVHAEDVAGAVGRASLVPTGPWADQVGAAGSEVSSYLNGLKQGDFR